MTKEYLANVQFAVLSLGDSLYGANFATVGKKIHEQLAHVGCGVVVVAVGSLSLTPVSLACRARPLLDVAVADQNVSGSAAGSQQGDFVVWQKAFFASLARELCVCPIFCAGLVAVGLWVL